MKITYQPDEIENVAYDINSQNNDMVLICNSALSINRVGPQSDRALSEFANRPHTIMGTYGKPVTTKMIWEDYQECVKLWKQKGGWKCQK